MMTSDKLLIKFKEDGVNAKAETPESTVGGENLLSLKKSTCKYFTRTYSVWIVMGSI